MVVAMKEMEDETEDNIAKAQEQVDKVTSKHNALVQKYNDLQEKFMQLSIEHENCSEDIRILREKKEKIQKSSEESLRGYKELSEEMTQKVLPQLFELVYLYYI